MLAMEILQNPTFALFAILFVGLAIGNISFKGIALGSSGVLFAALAAGHFGLRVPEGLTDVGTALFVYCVGLGVGNRFFAALRSRGKRLVLLSALVVTVAGVTAWALCTLLGVDGGLGAGLFAGACTSTPALAAAIEAQGSAADVVNIGYAVAYPFGVIGVVLFVQLLPRLLRADLDGQGAAAGPDPHKIIARVVRVTHTGAVGEKIGDFMTNRRMRCRITRVLQGEVLAPLTSEDVFSEGQRVLMVGEREEMEHDAGLIGSILRDGDLHPRTYTDETAELIVLSQLMCNKTLRELDTLGNYGIVVSRVTRLGATFVPTADTEIMRNDVLRVVGAPRAIEVFKAECGHRSSALNVADVLSLSGGLVLGILLGQVQLSFVGGSGFSLGMAGGPLIVALILGHFGKVGPLVGYMPRPTRLLVMELGLVLFLAGAGVKGGGSLVSTLQSQGITLFLMGVLITLVPMLVAYVAARKLLHMDLPEALGGICGSMTSTPALGAITSKTDRQEPVIAYSTAYPAALILMTVLAKLLCSLL